MLQDLANHAAAAGLEIHPGKTKILTNAGSRKGYNAKTSISVSGACV